MTKVQVFITTSQEWTCPAGVHNIDVVLIGGGGNGGNGACEQGDAYYSGQGGAAGAQTTGSKITVTPDAGYAITVGGACAASSGFGLTANGGASGGHNGYTTNSGSPGAAGLQVGSYPTAGTGGTTERATSPGAGGAGWGAGGGGGAGGYAYYGQGAGYPPGGAGAPGVVIITYYLTEPSFSADSTSGISPKTITFTATATESPTAWAWAFGDGATSAVQSPSHTYTTTGRKTVSLTVTNAYSTVTLTKTDYITVYWTPNAHGTIIQADWMRGAI